MTQSTAAPATLGPNEPFNYEFQGWTLTQGPPSMTQEGTYVPTPSPVVVLQEEPFRAVPLQQIDPANPESQNLTTTAQAVAVDGGEAWKVEKGADSISITLTVPPRCLNCNLTAYVAYLDGDPQGEITFYINGVGAANQGIALAANGSPLLAIFGPSQFKTGANVITISSASVSFYIKSISVQSDPDSSRILKAGYRWVAFCQADATPNGSNMKTYTRTNGVTNTDTRQFQETIGITEKEGYLFVSAVLSASFSATQSHSISVQETTTISSSFTFTSKSGITNFQVWQLCMVYSLDGLTLYNNQSDADVPDQTRQFPM